MSGDAGSTAVSITPAAKTVQTGTTVTLDVVVESVGDGVGAQTLSVSLSDPSVATITDAQALGNAGLDSIDVATDGSSATISAARMDTATSGSVTIASVDVELTDPGTTVVDLAVETLADEQGRTYTVTETNPGAIGTTDPVLGVTAENIGVDGTATIDLVASDAEQVTIENLWTDWQISAVDGDGATSSVDPPETPTDGTLSLNWNSRQTAAASVAITPNADVDPDPTYVGGEYLLTVRLNGGEDERTESFVIGNS